VCLSQLLFGRKAFFGREFTGGDALLQQRSEAVAQAFGGGQKAGHAEVGWGLDAGRICQVMMQIKRYLAIVVFPGGSSLGDRARLSRNAGSEVRPCQARREPGWPRSLRRIIRAMHIRFTKMQGAGNDFVVLDETRGRLGLRAAQYRWLARRPAFRRGGRPDPERAARAGNLVLPDFL